MRIAAAFAFDTIEHARAAERDTHKHFGDTKHQKEWFHVSWKEVASWLESTGAKQRSEE
jgi:hypothetical protein